MLVIALLGLPIERLSSLFGELPEPPLSMSFLQEWQDSRMTIKTRSLVFLIINWS